MLVAMLLQLQQVPTTLNRDDTRCSVHSLKGPETDLHCGSSIQRDSVLRLSLYCPHTLQHYPVSQWSCESVHGPLFCS